METPKGFEPSSQIEKEGKQALFQTFTEFDHHIKNVTGREALKLTTKTSNKIGDAVEVASYGPFTVYSPKKQRVVRLDPILLSKLSKDHGVYPIIERFGISAVKPFIEKDRVKDFQVALDELNKKRIAKRVSSEIDFSDLMKEEADRFADPFLVVRTPTEKSLLEKEREAVQFSLDFSKVDEKWLGAIPDALKRLPKELEFKKGQQLIVGPNGSGKSTFLDGYYLANWAHKYQMTPQEFIWQFPDALTPNVPSIGFASAITIHEYVPTEILDLARGLEKEKQKTRMEDGGAVAYLKWANTENRSKRQSNDDFKKKFFEARKIKDFTGLLFLDEPEQGMDPWRHSAIEEELEKDLNPGAVSIIATNSPILAFEEKFRKLDLREPEKGFVENS